MCEAAPLLGALPTPASRGEEAEACSEKDLCKNKILAERIQRGLARSGEGRESFISTRTRFLRATGMNPSALRYALRSLLAALCRCGVPSWILCAQCAAPGMSFADSVTLHPSADTTLFETNPDNNLGATPNFVSGRTAFALQPFRSRGEIGRAHV